jgi:hypothetical protein
MKKRIILKPLLLCDRENNPLSMSVGPRIGAKALENRKSLPVPRIEERFPSCPAHSIVAILTELSRPSVRPYTLMRVLFIFSEILMDRKMSFCTGCSARVFISVPKVNNRSV